MASVESTVIDYSSYHALQRSSKKNFGGATFACKLEITSIRFFVSPLRNYFYLQPQLQLSSQDHGFARADYIKGTIITM